MIRTSDGAQLRIQDIGQGQPVILVHGWPLSSDMFQDQIFALLQGGYRVVTYERQGSGRSDALSYDRFADDLADLIDGLDLSRVVLIGISTGAGEVARYLARHGSAYVDRVVLVSAVAPCLLKDERNPHGIAASILDGMRQWARADGFDFLQNFARRYYGDAFMDDPLSQAQFDWTFALSIMAAPECIDFFSRADFRPDLKAFDVPTLIVHGTEDRIAPVDCSARVAAAAIPHAILAEYSGEPHGLFATAAERLNEDLLAFLSTGSLKSTRMAFEELALVVYEPVRPAARLVA